MPKVSVIVNTVDRPTDLKRCLVAILNQSYREFEMVVVNNGVGPETRDLLWEIEEQCQNLNIPFKVVDDQTKKLSYLFNLGWKSVDPHSLYFAFCADDTEPDPFWLEQAVDYLDRSPDCGGVSGPTLSTVSPPGEMFYLRDLARKNIFTRAFLRLYEYFVMEDRTLEPGYWPQSGAFTMGAGIPLPQIKEPIEIDLLTSGNMVVKRTAMEKVGGFDENFYFNHADGDLFIRMKKIGYKLVFHPKVTVLHHMRFGPTRYPWILGRDTAFYYLKDVRPRSIRGWIGLALNLWVFNSYFVFKALQLRKASYLRGISGFLRGILDFLIRKTPERDNLLAKFAVSLAFLALFVYVYKDLWHYGMLAYGDAVPFPKDLGQAWSYLSSAWDIRSPGARLVPQIHVLYSLLPVEAVLMAVSGRNSIMAQRIFHYLPLPLSFLTMYFLLSRLVGSRFSRFLGGFIYSLNLFMVGEFLGGFEGNLYIQAFLPILLIWLWRLYKGRRFVSTTISYTLLLSLAYVLSDHVFLFLLPFLILLLVSSAVRSCRSRKWGSFLKVVVALVISHLFIFLITAYHSFYYFKVALPFLSGEKIPANVLEFLKRNVDDTYRFFTLGSALRGGGSYFMNLYAEGEVWARSGFILPALAFSWFLFKVNRTGKRLKVGLFLTFLAVVDLVFINFTRGERLSWLFKDLPFLFRFRNPSRPTLFLLMIYSVLIPLTIDALVSRFRSFKGKIVPQASILIALLLSVALAVYYFKPSLSGDLTMSKNRGIGAQITPRYYDLGAWLSDRHAEEGFFRTFFVPWDHENAEVKLYWIDPYALAVPINYGAYQPGSSYLPGLKRIYGDLVSRKNKNLSLDLAEYGVKYVIVNLGAKDTYPPAFTFDYQTPWLLGSPQLFQGLVENQAGFEYAETVSQFRIYRNVNFSREQISAEKAGLPPSNYPLLQRTHSLLLLISLTSFLLAVLTLIYARARSF